MHAAVQEKDHDIAFNQAKKSTNPVCAVRQPSYNLDWVIGKLFGDTHWCKRWVIDLCEATPALLTHIMEQTPDYTHFICLVRLALLQKPMEEDMTARHCAELIMNSSRKKLLQQLYGICPKGLPGIMTKLGGKPHSKNTYKRLMRLMGDGNAVKYLCHARRIYPYQLHWLENFPSQYRKKKIIDEIRKSDDYRNIKYIITVMDELGISKTPEAIVDSLKEFRHANHSEWFADMAGHLSFSEPPWPGNDWIQPVTNGPKLLEVKRKFDNCVMNYIGDILLGVKYFYVSDRGPAVVSLARDPVLGWQLEEVSGIKNKTVPSRHKQLILQSFSDAGIEPQLTVAWWTILY